MSDEAKDGRPLRALVSRKEEAGRVTDMAERSAKLRAARMAVDGEPGLVAQRPKAEHPIRKATLTRER